MKTKLIACAVIAIILMGVFLLSCSEREVTFEPVVENLKYELSPLLDKFNEFGKPTGITIVDKKILVADSEKHCIFIFDEEGSYIETIGSYGNGNVQFNRPMGMFYHNDIYYIVDAGNSRVQLLNNDFTFNTEIILENIGVDMSYNDIVVAQNGDIYVSAEHTQKKNAFIYKIENKDFNNILKLGKNLTGYLSIYNENITFANNMEYHIWKNMSSTGESFVYQIDVSKSKVKKLFELPYRYATQDFIETGEGFITYSTLKGTLDLFSHEGDYVETLYKFESNQLTFLAYNESEDYFLISSPYESKVYCIKRITEAE